MENLNDALNEVPTHRELIQEAPAYNLDTAHEQLTLLDYFAGQYLQGVIAYAGESSTGKELQLAEECYEQAAAMLEARLKYIKP